MLAPILMIGFGLVLCILFVWEMRPPKLRKLPERRLRLEREAARVLLRDERNWLDSGLMSPETYVNVVSFREGISKKEALSLLRAYRIYVIHMRSGQARSPGEEKEQTVSP